METSTVQIYIAQGLKLLTDPRGIIILLAMFGLAIAVVITQSGRWVALSLAIFAIACSIPGGDKSKSHIAFFAPLELIRVSSRPITVVVLFMLLASMIGFDRGPRRRLMPASFWMFIAYQYFACVRLLLVPNLADRAIGAFAIITLMVVVWCLTLAPSVQSLRASSWGVWSIAGCGIAFVITTLIQYPITPSGLQFQGRLFGMTANANFAAYLLAFVLPSMCYLLIRRKQGLWVTLNMITLGISIPLAVIMLIWTGSRGGMMTAIVGIVVFFRRRLGRFAIAGAFCAIIGLFLAPYLGDAFGGVSRFLDTSNTRTLVWARMLESIYQNPFFGHISSGAGFYETENVGEGGFLMSLSLYGVLGTVPLAGMYLLLGREYFALWRARRVIPELNDLADLTLAFWCSFTFANLFESSVVSYFTNAMFIMYSFFILQGFLVDYAEQAVAERSQGFPVLQPDGSIYHDYALAAHQS